MGAWKSQAWSRRQFFSVLPGSQECCLELPGLEPLVKGGGRELGTPRMPRPSRLLDGLVLTSSLSFADLQEPDPLADDDLMLLKCLETFDDEDL